MIKIENVKVFNITGAVYSARNAMNSWHLSDSDLENDILGENDLKLAKKLSKAGTDHSKYLRMITVYMDITAPLYWWKQIDQYKIGVTTSSTSTMHKIHEKEFTLDDFSHEHLINSVKVHLMETIEILNEARDGYINFEKFDTNNIVTGISCKKDLWWQMIQLLPSSYNQKRTVMLNYQVLKNMYHARNNHKLTEWVCFCDEIKRLPYMEDFINEMGGLQQ